MEVIAKLKPSLRKISQTPLKDEIAKAHDYCSGEKFQANKENNSHHIALSSSPDAAWDFVDPLYTPSSLLHSYNLEWEFLFNKSDMMKKLKERALEGNLRSSRFRSVAWKIFLEVLPPNISDWVERTRISRAKFEELKNHLIVNPRKAMDSVDIKLNNPLSQDEESPWNKFFQDNELRLTIKQDVIRTYPKIEFFQSNQLRNLMVDILFVFAKENTDVSYRQGMHELLAPLIFVLHCDHQAYLHACEIESVLNVMKEVLDPTYLEHDAFAMFCKVMAVVEPWYLSKDIFYSQSKNGSWKSLEHVNATPFSKSPDLNPASIIVTKLSRIQGIILKKADPVLHKHLDQLEILPQIYGIRWLRLLFGREFPMHDLLMLWDAVFGDGVGFDLVDYIFVAMLLYLRDILLASDYAVCLTILMKFPPVADVHYFVLKALWIREPNRYPEPPVYSHQGSIRASSSSSMDSSMENMSNCATEGGSQAVWKSHFRQLSQSQRRQTSVLGGFSSFSRKFSRPRTLSVPKSSSEPMNLQTDISPDLANSPIGSTVSLSHVEESMYRHIPSGTGFAQLETSNLRSAQSSPGFHHSTTFPLTPDDVSITSSPTNYNSLPGKSKNEQKPTTKLEREQLEKILQLQRELNDMSSMCRYCSSKLDVTIGRLQQDVLRQSKQVDDIMVSLAGLKLIRDILNGTVRFSQRLAAEDEQVQTNEYYCGGDKCNTGIASPESDKSVNTSSCREDLKISERPRGKLFYISSEDTDSPDFLSPEALAVNLASHLKGNNSVELNDFHTFQDRNVQAETSSRVK